MCIGMCMNNVQCSYGMGFRTMVDVIQKDLQVLLNNGWVLVLLWFNKHCVMQLFFMNGKRKYELIDKTVFIYLYIITMLINRRLLFVRKQMFSVFAILLRKDLKGVE